MHHIALTDTDSTNTQALALWRGRSLTAPLLVTAKTQTAGVGRSGRPWLSPAGGVWMTIAWPMKNAPAEYASLPLLVGLIVRDTLAAEAGVACQIKWPNDLIIRDKKIAGVLCRAETGTSDGLLLIGIGINANFPATALGTHLRHPATSLLDETGRSPDPATLARAVAGQIESAVARLEAESLTPRLPAIRKNLAWLGQPVTCTDDQGEILAAGTFAGIDDTGAALIESAGERRPIAIGELHFSRHI